MSVLFQSESNSVWAPFGVFAAILVILAILLALPFLMSRARQNPTIDMLIEKITRLMNGSADDDHVMVHMRPIARGTLRSLQVSQYQQHIDPESPEADCCPICFYEYRGGQAIITLACSHYYHKDCITKWLKRDATCPICKTHVGSGHKGDKVGPGSSAVVDGLPAPARVTAVHSAPATIPSMPAELAVEAAAVAAVPQQPAAVALGPAG